MTDNFHEGALRTRARMPGLEYIPPRLIDTRREPAAVIPEAIARAFHVLAQSSSGLALEILSSGPLNFGAIDAVRFYFGGKVEVALATDRAIEESIDRVYETFDLR